MRICIHTLNCITLHTLHYITKGLQFFFGFFSCFFFEFFPVFLRGLIEPVICNVLEFGSIICMVFATFWNSDRSLHGICNVFGDWVYRLHRFCNVLECGCIVFHGICNIWGRRSLICMVFAMFWTLGLSFCVVFAMFWSLDSLFDWYLQRIGAGRGISELMLQKRATKWQWAMEKKVQPPDVTWWRHLGSFGVETFKVLGWGGGSLGGWYVVVVAVLIFPVCFTIQAWQSMKRVRHVASW